MQKDKALTAVKTFVENQSILDTSMTLAELTRKLGDRTGQVAGYTFAWEKYVYDIGLTPPDMSGQRFAALQAERISVASKVLNLNIKIEELMVQARDNRLDEVAGYIYTEDKNTFIVASELMDEEVLMK